MAPHNPVVGDCEYCSPTIKKRLKVAPGRMRTVLHPQRGCGWRPIIHEPYILFAVNMRDAARVISSNALVLRVGRGRE